MTVYLFVILFVDKGLTLNMSEKGLDKNKDDDLGVMIIVRKIITLISIQGKGKGEGRGE